VRYINHRLKRAAVGAPLEFPRDVTDLIHRRSRGVPRIINVIADATLLFAYGLDRQGVDLATAQEALGELDTTGVLASYQSEGSLAAGSAPLSIVDAQDAMQFTDAVRQRERNLIERERDLRDREQALTAQQRVLEEQARLLAATRSAAALAATPAAGPATTPVTEPVSAATAPQPEVRPAPTASASSAFSQPAVPVAPAVRVVPSTAARTSAPSQQTSTTRSAHPTTPPAGRTVAGGGQSGSSVARPVFRPGSPDATGTNRIFVPTQVQVQPYRPPVRIQQHSGLWSRLRRVLFGVTEPEAGA
jgi:hypothetical protein